MTAPSRGLDLLRRAWAPQILLELDGQSRRFNSLLHALAPISDRVLTERLSELVVLGFVRRDVEAGPPLRVFYELTGEAEPLLEPLRQLAAI